MAVAFQRVAHAKCAADLPDIGGLVPVDKLELRAITSSQRNADNSVTTSSAIPSLRSS